MMYVPTVGVCELHGRVQGKELNFERQLTHGMRQRHAEASLLEKERFARCESSLGTALHV